MTPSDPLPVPYDPDASQRVTQAILDFISRIPDSTLDSSNRPDEAAQRLARRAAQRAALTSGSLALPPGPLGWLTVLPEILAIWRIQAQMVSDIAAVYGRHAELGREQMLWCLFRHTAALAFRDLVVRMGDRLLFRRMSYAVVERVAKQVGVKVGQRALGKGLSRWLPVIGAVGVGAYAYYDTGHVAATAIEMFSQPFATEPEMPDSADEATAAASEPARAAAARRRGAKQAAVHTVKSAARKGARKAVASAKKRTAAKRAAPPKPD